MGLTHYWQRFPVLPPTTFARAVADCRKIMPHIGVALADADGSGTAVFRDEVIMFNGVGTQRCEPLVVRQRERPHRDRLRVLSFTKTHRLPYDVCVRVALIILRHHLGQFFEVASDDAHWEAAGALCQKHLGYGQEFRLGK
jgi:hypothetical protein